MVNPSPRRKDNDREEGQALFVVLVVLALVLGVGAAIVSTASLNTQQVRHNSAEEQLLAAARTGIGQAKFQLWEKLQQATPGAEISQVRPFLDGLGIMEGVKFSDAGAPQILTSFQLSSGNDTAGIDVTAENTWVRVLVERHDLGNNTFLVLRSVATTWDTGVNGGKDPQTDLQTRVATLPGNMRVSESVYRYGGVPFAGFEYALLTNAVNCMFCHTDIDNSERYYNPGTADVERVKVASLEELRLLQGSYAYLTDTRIAGTLMVQGFFVDIYGNPIDPETAGYFDSRPFTNGTKIDEDTTETSSDPDDYFTGSPNFADAGKDGDGNYNDPSANLYKNYPEDPTTQEALAGRLPNEFPPVISDDDEDRHVDSDEWNTHVNDPGNDFNGTLSAGNVGGSGGAFVATNGYSHTSLPTGDGLSGEEEHEPEITGKESKNVILVGTEADPILLNGNVAIDGDVIISGVVKGNGQLLARGNIYIQGDVRYADGVDGDGNRTFGLAADGVTENAIAYAAGGSIVHGEYLTTNSGNDYTGENTSESGRAFTNNELGLWNRGEFSRAMPYIDNETKWPTADPQDSSGTNNVANPLHIADYKPRYYTTRDGGNVWLFGAQRRTTGGGTVVGSECELVIDGTSARWDSSRADNIGDIQNQAYRDSETLSDVLAEDTETTKSSTWTTHPLNPSWISESDMRAITVNADNDRAASSENGKPFRLDGLFYTNNSMLFMARSSTSSGGKLFFNGSVVAADTGILPGTHLQLNYDARTKAYLEIETDKEVGFYLVNEREGRSASNN